MHTQLYSYQFLCICSLTSHSLLFHVHYSALMPLTSVENSILILYIVYILESFVIYLFYQQLNTILTAICVLQKHAIIKKRVDSNGNMIQVRYDRIGVPKLGKPIQKHGGEISHNETYCGSCYGAENVRLL